jgi:2-polyprenyl-6-methoxyphenol hydroxylase-like FAD-dependent oxidoreductase
MEHIRGHAVVLGASMGGMLAARVLADHYTSVTVVERDELPSEPVNRRGVPQGRQPHLLLARAAQILEGHFPGILDELVASGAPVWDDGDLSKLWARFGGHLLVRSGSIPDPHSLVNYYPTRPLLEWAVRRRLAALSNVEILGGRDVAALTATPDCARVTGVRIVRRADNEESVLSADLVVDATGRGSRTPVFLEQLGYGRPLEDELMVHIVYASQPVHIADGVLHENLVAIMPDATCPRAFVLFRGENDTWLMGAGAVGGLEPARNRDEILSIAADLAPARIVAAARASRPLAEVTPYRIPSNRWRRYDKMARTPQHLLVVGDAVCSFNPIYGQGMTVAAIESLTLRDCLRDGDQDLPRRFFRGAAKTIKVAWQTAVGSDLALPQIQGPRPLSTRLTNNYLDRVLTAAETDPWVSQQFLRVTGMIDPPTHLFRPAFVSRVLRRAARPQDRRRNPEQSGALISNNIRGLSDVLKAG